MQAEGLAWRVVILDCDAHQGNGTAAILRADPTIFTFSIHGPELPFHKEPGDLDIALEDGTVTTLYLPPWRRVQALTPAGADPAIYRRADPFVGDKAGRLALSKAGLAARDPAGNWRLPRGRSPVVVVMAGGYAKEVEDTVDIHFRRWRLPWHLATARRSSPCRRTHRRHPNMTQQILARQVAHE